jgi:hypothetical protein
VLREGNCAWVVVVVMWGIGGGLEVDVRVWEWGLRGARKKIHVASCIEVLRF